jgi:hypothetical protein
VGAANVSTNLSQADFLTRSEFHRGPDLLRPGTLTCKHVDPAAVAFIYTQHPCEGDDPDIQVSPEDRRFISWPAAMGHERVADREPVLRAMFGEDFREATKVAAYEHEAKIAYDSVELRRLAVQRNLFGRHGRIRGVPCQMLWNRCEVWEAMLDKLLVLLGVPDEGLVTMGNAEQWWARDWRAFRGATGMRGGR